LGASGHGGDAGQGQAQGRCSRANRVLGRHPRSRRSSTSSATLANGLKVYTSRDATTPNVTVQVWYGVGSKDDPERPLGLRAPVRTPDVQGDAQHAQRDFDRLTEDVGGFNNASTWDDFTNYYEVVPANHLQRLLWAEAERLGSLVIDEAVFKSERDVVKEELRQRVLANPYGRFFALNITQPRSPTTPTSARASARSRSWTRRRSTTCAPSTRPTTAPTTPP
jgi:hypothetical protein